jgi:hypothetical protein
MVCACGIRGLALVDFFWSEQRPRGRGGSFRNRAVRADRWVLRAGRDQFHLHFGARILHEQLRKHRISHHYEEFDDNHSFVDYRMELSLPWLYPEIL